MIPARSVFINYRRKDTGWAANAVGASLRRRLGAERVFLDNSSIGLGRDFAEVIEDAVRRCDALIALIGPGWDISPLSDRLAKEDDWVRKEILLAHDESKDIIPVLVDRHEGPDMAKVPAKLHFIAGLPQEEIRQSRPDDVEDLADKITMRSAAPEDLPMVGAEPTRKALDRLLRSVLPPAQQRSGNRDRLVDLILAVLGPADRLTFIAPARLEGRPRGSATVLVTLTHVIVLDVGEDFLLRGEIWLPRGTVRMIEVVATLPLFAGVVLHTIDGRSVKLIGLFRDQARQLADSIRA